jgi:hypothetical protein
MIAHAWLATWLLATWACLGGMAWTAVHSLTGGAWGDGLGASLRRQRRWLPIVAMLGLPLLFAAAHVFPWIASAPEPWRQWYLNYPALAYRTLGCFVAWAIGRWLLPRAPALTLIVWLFADGVFANDWIVSLTPAWRSSDIGLVAAVGQLSVAMAVAAFALSREPDDAWSRSLRCDAAGLLMALGLGWAYLAGVDYLTAWMADQPYETAWYLPRTEGAWAAVAVAAVFFHLILPFCLLLPESLRSHRIALRTAGASMVLGEACHLAWMVLP